MADLMVSQNSHGFCDVDVYIKDGDAEWLYQVSKDLESGDISQSGPRYAATKDGDFDDGDVHQAPARVQAEMIKSYQKAIDLIEETIAKNAADPDRPGLHSGRHP